MKLRSFGVPTDRRTRAPAPSDCSRARKDCLIARGCGGMIVDGFVVVEVERKVGKDVAAVVGLARVVLLMMFLKIGAAV